MEGFELIKQGAEAKLYCGKYLNKPALIKERFIKKYRQPELDKQITNDRMKAECRIITRCKSIGVTTPCLYLADLERRIIIMEYLENSITAKQFFDTITDDLQIKKMCQNIGYLIGKIHKNNIIHGDLTTSNMLIVVNKIYLIDFGLSYMEISPEDKAVDLYVLERALISTHKNATDMFPIILEQYEKDNPKGSKAVLNKFEEVRARGRKRTMVG